MSIVNTAYTQNDFQKATQWPKTGGKEPLAGMETQKLKEDIEKEEKEIKRINRELSEHITNGEQNMAELKGVELSQKQMQIQAMQNQIDKLEKPGRNSGAEGTVSGDASASVRPKFDEFIKTSGQPEEAPGIYRLEKSEDGEPRIVFAPPEDTGKKPEDSKKKPVEVGKAVSDDSEWQAEIAKLKEKRSQLSQTMSSADDDEEKRRALEAQLAAVEAELAAKDTEAYRKQRTKMIYMESTMMAAEDAMKLGSVNRFVLSLSEKGTNPVREKHAELK